MRPEFDSRDADILAGRIAEWNKIDGPRVGDYVRMLDGSLRRFTHDWGDEIQTTCGDQHPCRENQSFHFGNGYMSFSGSLDPSIPKTTLDQTSEVIEGPAWFFHHDFMQAHSGVYCKVPCRVYQQKVSTR